MKLKDCRIIELPRINDPRGNLTYVESNRQIPFATERIFYLYDVPGGTSRAGHALRESHQFLIATSGSFDVVLDDGFEKQRYQLNRSYYGLYVPALIWREIDNFSSNSICLVLASARFDEADYYREYDEFISAVNGRPR